MLGIENKIRYIPARRLTRGLPLGEILRRIAGRLQKKPNEPTLPNPDL